MKKTLLALIVLMMVLTLTGCGKSSSGNSAAQKQEYYSTFFDNHKLAEDPFLIKMDTDIAGLNENIEFGIKGTLLYCMLSFNDSELLLYSTNEKAYMKTKADGEDSGWLWASLPDGEALSLYEEEDMTGFFDGAKTVTYKETVKENGKEYDVVSVVIKGEDGEDDLPTEVWIHKDKVEKIVYDTPSVDENGNDITLKTVMTIHDGSSIAVPKEAENGKESDQEELTWALIGFIFGGLDFDIEE